MNLYRKEIKETIKIGYTIGFILLIIGILLGVYTLLLHLHILSLFSTIFDLIKIGALAALALGIIVLFFNKIYDKRDNILYDGTTIKFRTNRKVLASYELKDIYQLFPYRSEIGIAYSLANALAFRMETNSPWITIDSTYKDVKSRKYRSSIDLIKLIVNDYSAMKTQRFINDAQASKAVRFIYLVTPKEMDNLDERNNCLKKFETIIKESNASSDPNNYGIFRPNNLDVSKDSLYINKKLVATSKENYYIKIRSKYPTAASDFYAYEVIDFYNHEDKLVVSIDLTLVINSEFFKMLVKSIFIDKTKAE